VHNQLPVTKGFISQLFKSTENFRLIFVDNGSTDGTNEFLTSGGDWSVISPGENLGIIKGRNLGAQSVQSDYFLNIDNDQYVNKGWLQSLHDKMSKGFDIVGCEAWKMVPPFNKTDSVVVSGSTIKDNRYFPHKRCVNPNDKWTYVGCGGMLIKTEVYIKIGLFDERFSPAYFEDPDLNFRAFQAGFKIGWEPKCSINHLAHQTINIQKLFSKNPQFLQSWGRFVEKWGDYFPEYAKNK
jgi:GT2 family glycosyltransferase